MGWVWRDDDGDPPSSGEIAKYGGSGGSPGPGDRCSTRKVVKSRCRTEEVEPGKFIRKCERTEEILRDCVGRPVEVVQSNKEYTEDDVTEQVLRGSFSAGSPDHGVFDFPGLQSDIDAIGRSVFGNLDRFFEAAEEMKKGFFGMFDSPSSYDGDSSWSSMRRGVPIEEPSPRGKSPGANEPDSGLDLSGIAKDV
ncbi:fra a 1-associated protein [Syzygium oleosum]|uniref:fra a 1-associated protein n=1 Tax=Syzygium oleosum TaxID=219896 RepID=UPI0011D25C6E|nr:fra a 1-associated protein [Syzygium oleosum]